MKKTLITIPTYNERENIVRLIDEIFNLFGTEKNLNLLVVDDGSPDGTAEVIKEKMSYERRLLLIERENKLGLGSAYREAIRYGIENGYGRLIHMDADFSHRPEYLPSMLENLDKYDAVLGSRYVRGGGVSNWSLLRRLLSRGGNIYSRFILGIRIKDVSSGFKGFNRNVMEAIHTAGLRSDGYVFNIEVTYLLCKKGFSIYEQPIIFREREHGRSKISRRILLEALIRVWLFRLRRI